MAQGVASAPPGRTGGGAGTGALRARGLRPAPGRSVEVVVEAAIGIADAKGMATLSSVVRGAGRGADGGRVVAGGAGRRACRRRGSGTGGEALLEVAPGGRLSGARRPRVCGAKCSA
ncbi:hypothetical protein [Actinomadura napierensis]|uniref:Uncharacterized protein n=1 Tax=Actinomadura napierensis TaxID=267854 RepID=A0ABP5LWX1_9ACTN